MSTHYSKIIDLIASGEVDYKAIAIKLAKVSPSMFLRLHGAEETKPVRKQLLPQPAVRDIRNKINSGNLVSAIKALRESVVGDHRITIGLKEASDIIFVAAGREDNYLTKEYRDYVREINNT